MSIFRMSGAYWEEQFNFVFELLPVSGNEEQNAHP